MSTIADGTNAFLSGLVVASGQALQAAPQTLGQDDFLTLMITQLQNQDPVSPVDSNEFFSQLTQFSVVEGLSRMEQIMTDMTFTLQSSQALQADMTFTLQSSQALQASSLVGREVLVKSDVGYLEQDGTLSGAIRLEDRASAVSVQILDMDGNLVRELSLGPQEAGLAAFTWDGMTGTGSAAAAGQYRIKAQADIDGQTIAPETLVRGHVESVALAQGAQEMTLTLTGMDPAEISAVVEIL